MYQARWVTDLPQAIFTVAPDGGHEPLEVQVDAAASTVQDGFVILTYEWDFGDGSTASGREASHTYERPGRFTVGLTVTTNDRGLTAEAERDVLVSVRAEDVLPWSAQDVGDVAGSGASRPDAGEDCLMVQAAVGNISGTTDEFHFVSQEVPGDFSLVVEIADWDPSVATFSKAGLMVRDSLEPDARHASVFVEKFEASFRHRFIQRVETGGMASRITRGKYTDPRLWLRIERQDQEILASLSENGSDWSEPDRSELDNLPDTLYVGFAASGMADGPLSVVRVCGLHFDDSPVFLRGDCDGDGFVGGGVNDVVVYLNWAFRISGSATPGCLAACDMDGDGFVGGSVNDALYYVNWAFLGRSPPPPPFPDCGVGNAADEQLGCEAPPACP